MYRKEESDMRYARPMRLVVLFALAVPVAAAAATIHVPSEQPTIQQGIDAASAGDIVLVAPGTYTGVLNRDLDFGGANLVVVSETGAEFAIIDCADLGRGFLFHSGEDTTAVVRGFTITNAVADTGAGAYCKNGSSPRFEECTFNGCEALSRGGGLCCDASSPVVRGCEFAGNLASHVTRDDGSGGGMSCLSGSSPLIVDTDFIENNVRYSGGGLHSQFSSPQLLRCEFTGNLGADYATGTGAWLQSSDGAVLAECTFRENGGVNCVGGGLYVLSSTVTVTDCIFVDNISGAAGGMRMTGANASTVTGCTFVGNRGAWNAAGAIECFSEASPTITNCTFVENGTHQVWCDGASPTLEYCIFAYSTAGLAVYCEDGTETPSINHCFVFENADGDSLSGGNYHDNEYADPRFCAVETGDVTLCADSPCLPGVTWGLLVGAEGEGCASCGSATEQRTWGSIKAMYR